MEYRMVTATSARDLQEKVAHLYEHGFIQFGEDLSESVGEIIIFKAMLARDI